MSRRLSGAAVAVLLVLTTAACSSDGKAKAESDPTESPSASTASSPAPQRPPAPPKGACYRLTFDELTEPTNQSRPVACNRSHSAQTIYVGRLKLVVDGHALRVDSAAAKKQLATTCPSRFAAYVGGEQEDRDLSRLRVVWFSPTLEQADAGARWFRCDLVAFGTDDNLSRGTTAIPSGVLGSEEGRERYALCGTAAPATPGFKRVQCGLDHSWRAIATIGLEGEDSYPGEDTVREDGDSECQDLAREVQDFALTFTYGWEWPTRVQWKAGQRFGYCWAPD